jgi:hypothetical protein
VRFPRQNMSISKEDIWGCNSGQCYLRAVEKNRDPEKKVRRKQSRELHQGKWVP